MMTESKILWSLIPEMRCEGADKPESATRLPEGPILVNPYGVEEYRGCFYYQDYQSYLDDEPYIRKFIKKYVRFYQDTGGKHFYIEYDDTNPDHRSAKEHSHLLILLETDKGLALDDIVSTFKEASTGRKLCNRHIIPLKELELSTHIYDRKSKRAILKDINKVLKYRRLYEQH